MANLDIQLNNKAVAQSQEGDHKSSLTYLNKALLACSTNLKISVAEKASFGENVNTPDSSENYHDNNFEFTGDYDEGMSTFSRPIFIPPTGAESVQSKVIKVTILFNLGITYTRLGDDAEAAANFRLARSLKEEELRIASLRSEKNENTVGSEFNGPKTVAFLHNLGHIDYRAGNLEESLKLYQTALEISRNEIGIQYSDAHIACSLNCIGVVRLQMFQDTEECIETLAMLTDALAIYKGLEDIHGTTTVMNNRGRIMVVMDRLEEALEIYKDVYRMRKANSCCNNLDVAATLFNIGETCHLLGNIDDALKMYLEFLPVASMHLDEDHPDIVCVLKIIADAYSEKQQYERALEYFQRALKTTRKGNPPDLSENASILNRMGNLHYENGCLDEALRCYEEGLDVEHILYAKNDINLLVTIFNIARIYHNEDDLEYALEMYIKGLEIQRNCEDDGSLKMAGTLCSIGLIRNQLDEFEPSIEAFEEALEIRRSHLSDDSLIISSTLNSMGLVFFNNNHNEDALESFKECLAIRQRNLFTTNKDIATVLYNIATVYVDIDQTENAIFAFKDCLKLEREDERISGIISCLQRLGIIYKDLKHYDAAIGFYEEAVEICLGNSVDRASHVKVANIFGLLGGVYLAQNDSTNAAKTLARAIQANRIAGLPDDANLNVDLKLIQAIAS